MTKEQALARLQSESPAGMIYGDNQRLAAIVFANGERFEFGPHEDREAGQ